MPAPPPPPARLCVDEAVPEDALRLKGHDVQQRLRGDVVPQQADDPRRDLALPLKR